MEKEQYRSVIPFLFLEGKPRSEIKERLEAVYGDSFPSWRLTKIGLRSFNVVARFFFDKNPRSRIGRPPIEDTPR